ncbi:hypothetical protein [Photobacterium angustum]|uniref:hypothetical protein n=1 Tax=Photobacterium angustum TaxID=661 RepID=UPI000A6BD005|nr:hypothetical protein [Photobacterium angustum]
MKSVLGPVFDFTAAMRGSVGLLNHCSAWVIYFNHIWLKNESPVYLFPASMQGSR